MEAETPQNYAVFKVVVNYKEQYAIWPHDMTGRPVNISKSIVDFAWRRRSSP